MSPVPVPYEGFFPPLTKRSTDQPIDRPTDPDGLVLEAWAQGYMVGSLIIMFCITMANMRRGVLLHKLILLELFLGIWHGLWIFFHQPWYSWWLSVSAIFLNISWSLHNVIAWMKIKPFLSKPASWIYIGTVILVQPYWVVEIYANFAYFHDINTIFLKTRPWEALCRDPWWIFTTVALVYNIKVRYDMKFTDIIRISPRFGIMLGAMFMSLIFIVLDVCSVTDAFKSTLPVGINPFWKLAFVFKCLTDSVILDDFKTALDRLRAFKMSRLGSFSQDDSDRRARPDGNLERAWEQLGSARRNSSAVRSPDGAYIKHEYFPGRGLKQKSNSRHIESVPTAPKTDAESSRKNSGSADEISVTHEISITREHSPDGLDRNRPSSPIQRPDATRKRSQDQWMAMQNIERSAERDYGRIVRQLSLSDNPPVPSSPRSKNFSKPTNTR